MKFTLSWLRAHLQTEASPSEIGERLTAIGLEVDGIEDRGAALADFVVGDVLAARRHPDADRLVVCTVDVGGGARFDVVCGAPNARAGMKGVFARAGSRMPGSGDTLKRTTIRGVESAGMLCSERELGLSDAHEGIIDLNGDFPAGTPAAGALGLADPVFTIALTPNRADCAGVRGIARDLAAAGLGALKPLDLSPVAGTFESPIAWRRDLPEGARDACPMVVGRSFRGVTNGPSPQWLQDRLRAIGLRPISALVDITNYLTFDLARPLHVFDIGRVRGDLTMRLARSGEAVAALDGRTYILQDGMTVIADEAGVQGIGGIMGGAQSGCGAATTAVFLEVALFDPVRTAMTGRRLGIMSDARYRFERGVDPTSALWGAEIAARMILDICGGEASALSIAGEEPRWRRTIMLRGSRIAALGGLALADGEPGRILDRLGFEVAEEGGTLRAAVPPWRPDVEGEADLVEEVLRIHGYDAIPAVPLRAATAVPAPSWSDAQAGRARARRALAATGLIEAVTFSFMPERRAAAFGAADPDLVLANPISADFNRMRPSILPNLLQAAERNTARGLSDVALFEIGPQFEPGAGGNQSWVAAGIRVGGTGARHWLQEGRAVDAYDAKADAMAALGATGAPLGGLRTEGAAPRWYHPGRSGALMLGSKPLAWFGEIHPGILADLDLRGRAVAFEVMLDAVPPRRTGRSAARPMLRIAALQPVVRDFAFVVEEDTQADSVLRAARGVDRTLVAEVALFDVYRGPEIGAGRKSLAVAVTLQPREATLTDAEIEGVAGRIVAAVSRATGAVLRR